MKVKRCEWVDIKNPLYLKYHDEEWGVPSHSDKKLFEMLVLEGAQAGLSWSIILKKRSNYRKLFDGFNFNRVAKYNEKKIKELMEDEGIVRNELKIISMIKNATVFVGIRKEFGSFDKYIWGFVNNKPIVNTFYSSKELPTKTEISDNISEDLKKRGMNFVGSTIIYAFMQAVGMVNDHTVSCFRYKEINKKLRENE